MDILNNIGINPIFLLAQIANFAVLAWLLSKLLYGPVIKMLDERRAKIEKGLRDAEAAEQARAGAEAERARILDAARAEAQKLVAEANVRADQAAASVAAKAEADAARALQTARQDAEGERNRILGDLRSQVAALAIAAANKVVGATLDEQRQRALINEFFAKVPADVRVNLSGVSGKATVTSALPLTPAEQASVRTDLGLGAAEFKVDPAILGGLVVRVGDRVVDGSVSGKLGALHASLS